MPMMTPRFLRRAAPIAENLLADLAAASRANVLDVVGADVDRDERDPVPLRIRRLGTSARPVPLG